MHYTGQIYRPPSEAWTPLLEVTYGCSHNGCVYCTMYKDTPFGTAKRENIEADILEIKETYKYPVERIYLTGGDPFVLSPNKLLDISQMIHAQLDHIKTITCYASLYNLKNKSVEDLKKLKEAGYNEIYIGIETGYDKALNFINKNISLEESFDQLKKLKAAGMDYIAILMLGIGGKGQGEENAKATAKLLNTYMPKAIGMMTTSVQPGSKLYELRQEGLFEEATMREILEEQIVLLENLEADHPERTLYNSYHMVNQVQVQAGLDKKDQIINVYKEALATTPAEILDRPNMLIAR